MSLFVPFLFVMLHHRARGDFLGPLAMTAFLPSVPLDVLVHPLFSGTNPAPAFPFWRRSPSFHPILRLNDLVSNGIPSQFSDGMQVKFLHDVRPVGLGCLG